LTVDFLGKLTRGRISEDGRLLNTLEASSPDGIHLLRLEAGTATVDNAGAVIKLITIREATQVPQLPPDTEVVGNAYDFRPSGIIFDGSARLTLGYHINQLPENVESIALAYFNTESGWVDLQAERGVVAEVGQLTAPISHFTDFAVLAKIPPAVFTLSNLSISTSSRKIWRAPTFVKRTGETATINVVVTNVGGQQGSQVIVLKLNGKAVASKGVSLESGQSEQVTFTLKHNKPGNYMVQIGDLTGQFESHLWINWWLIAGLSLALVVLCWVVRRRLLGLVLFTWAGISGTTE
jgi:hypothetical protein